MALFCSHILISSSLISFFLPLTFSFSFLFSLLLSFPLFLSISFIFIPLPLTTITSFVDPFLSRWVPNLQIWLLFTRRSIWMSSWFLDFFFPFINNTLALCLNLETVTLFSEIINQFSNSSFSQLVWWWHWQKIQANVHQIKNYLVVFRHLNPFIMC